jgi:hypothetical protein
MFSYNPEVIIIVFQYLILKQIKHFNCVFDNKKISL